MPAMRNRGFVLIVALGVLGVLALLAATFATLSHVEKSVSASYVDRVRARLLAQSGVERTIAALSYKATKQAWDDTRDEWYYREMLNAPVGSLTWSAATVAALDGFTPTRAYGAAPRSLEQVVDATLATGTPGGLSFPDPADPRFSGSLDGTYELNGDIYAVRVLDCASQLYVNDQNPQMARVLNQLGTILNIHSGFALGTEIAVAAKNRGRAFSNKSEVLDEVFVAKLGPDEGRRRFDIAKDFLTCHAWVDHTTMHFGLKPAPAVAGVPAAPLQVTAIDTGGGFAAYVFASGQATYAAKFGGSRHWNEPRAPINVNTVTREVLVALLWGLSASFVDYDHPTGHLITRAVSISQAQAEAAADHIINARYTFGTPAGAWGFNDWMHLKNEVIDTIPGLDRFQKALIHANANPNTDIRKLNPDLLLVDSNPVTDSQDLVRLDKSDILVKSTELCFSSMGFFEIETLGRVSSGNAPVAQERIETIVKVFDAVRYTTQEQFEKDRVWIGDSSAEGDLLANGYPPVVSQPEYPYNNPKTSPTLYRSATGDVGWAADWDGNLILNGPQKISSGVSPANYNNGTSSMCRKPLPGNPANCAAGLVDVPNSGKDCAVSMVVGFNRATLKPNQSHANLLTNPLSHHAPRASHPEYPASGPDPEGVFKFNQPVNSVLMDDDYVAGYSAGPKRAFQINPAGALNTETTGFFEGGTDLQPFGLYVNYLKRHRYHTMWGDEMPTGSYTVEFLYKPEIDHWEWAKGLPETAAAATYNAGPASRCHLWGVGAATHGMNYEQWIFVQGSRVFLDMSYAGENYVMYCDHSWKAHTWHHIEISVVPAHDFTKADGSVVTVPPNAMLFVDGVPAAGVLGAGTEISDVVGEDVYPVKAMALPAPFVAPWPTNDVFAAPRMTLLSKLQAYSAIFGMCRPGTIGTMDNLVVHHWRSHDRPFTPRNRFHSTTYFNGSDNRSGTGYGGEKAGVYRKRLRAVENLAAVRDVKLGTVSCTHVHPYHEHLYGHDGALPTTSFGHITPAIRIKSSGGSYADAYYYDGCAGLPLGIDLAAGDEVHYLAWFEVPSMVPVMLSPILCDVTLTYITEPKTYYRLSSLEAR
jgi:hypothetical protein